MVTLRWLSELNETTTAQVRALLSAVRDSDGRPELPEGDNLPGNFVGGLHLLATETVATETVEAVGYAHLDRDGDAFGRQVGELMVAPTRRREGVGAAMVKAVVERAAATEDRATIRFWAHGNHPAAARLADRFGFSRVRELLVLKRKRSLADPSNRVLPPGIQVRTFVPGRDEQAVAELNARAFAWHPEQGQLTANDIADAQQQNWFDPLGFFLAEDSQGKLLGFHWTKVHPPLPTRFEGQAVGEVYVLGVDPDAQGSGLGKALTSIGLDYLDSLGLEQVILYVEGDNAPALNLYRKLGFNLFETDVQYELDR